MKYFLAIFISIFLFNCSFNKSELGVTNNNISQSGIDTSEEYSFEEYVNLLLKMNKFKKYPDINNISD